MKKRPACPDPCGASLSRWNRLELRLYRALGVRRFQRLLFALERIRHFNGHGVNPNYHLEKYSPAAAEAFTGYLAYHTILHLASLLLLVLLAVIQRVLRLGWGPLGIPAGLLFVVNVWCLMLQRYNCLRLRRLWHHCLARRARRVRGAEAALSAGGGAFRREDMLLAEKMLADLQAGRSVLLESRHIPALVRMAALLEPLERDARRARGTPMRERAPDAYDAWLYPGLARRVDGIQRRLRGSGVPLLDLAGCAVVTADAQTETAFGKLFPRPCPEEILERLTLLVRVLKNGEMGE